MKAIVSKCNRESSSSNSYCGDTPAEKKIFSGIQMDNQDWETPPEWAKNLCTLVINMSSNVNSLTEKIYSITIIQSTIKDNINTLRIKIDSFDTAIRHLDSKVSKIEEKGDTTHKHVETNSLNLADFRHHTIYTI